jgi:UDP-glucose-4-epimerase GalE
VLGGVSLLNAVLDSKVRKFIFSSSCAVYGTPEKVPISEDLPRVPVNPYGVTKLIFEQALEAYGPAYKLGYVCLRYFNAAGADESGAIGEMHSPETHLIPSAFEAIRGQRPALDIFGDKYPTPDGTCVRDYIHVLDIADSHVRALEEIDRVSGEAFNVGNSRGFSILEVIAAAERITGRKIPRKLGPRRPGDPAVLVASKEKLKRILGWEAAHSSLEEIIESAWAWQQKHPHGYADSATA